MRDAVIVSTARTPIGKAFRGAFNDTEAPALGGHVVRAAVARAGIDPGMVDDCIMGAAAQQGTQAYNLGRLCGVAGGLPDSTAGMTMDRQCSSGLMTIATAAKAIMCDEYDVPWCRTSTRTATGMCPKRCWKYRPRPTSR